MGFWENQRVTVTGGAGFLGSYVVKKLGERGCKCIFVPRSKNYDLLDREASGRFMKIQGLISSFI